MENLGARKVKGARRLIEAADARLLYLPPCSADGNPIELAWSQLKTSLRRVAARTGAALDRAIAEGLHAVTTSDARGFFKPCGYLS